MKASRRSFLSGLITAPAVILTPGLLMPVKAVSTHLFWPEPEPYPFADEVDQFYRYIMNALHEAFSRPLFMPTQEQVKPVILRP